MTQMGIKLAAWMIAGAGVVMAVGGNARAAQESGSKPAKASVCAGCHGANGMGNAAAGFPALAGLPPKYLDHQLWAFVHGTRRNSVMMGLAKGLDAKSRKQLAEYYATMKVTPPKSLPAPPKGDLGRTIAIHGLHTGTPKAVPACESCHGAGGLGQGEFPRLAGQSEGYLAGQLKDWQSGSRRDALMHIMRKISDKLSAKDIKAVAEYFASLSPAPQAAQSGGGSGQGASGSGSSSGK
jgi:cytochrome c553